MRLTCGFLNKLMMMMMMMMINKYNNNNNNNNGYTVGVFIDFQSAFDMMWRKGLLIKLKGGH